MKNGQWLVDSVGTRWFFDSGALCLDLGYTGDYGLGVPAWEHLHRPDDLTAWLTDRFGRLSRQVTPAEFTKALRLRAAITDTAWALVNDKRPKSADIDLINVFAAGADIAPALQGGGHPPEKPSVARALSTVARDAVAVFSADAGRVRQCEAGNCALIFVDSSRPSSRRWCSMQRCGNRTKVRVHRSKLKEVS
jgi:predicted RNA-binding Zn ribbon-like protein